MNIIVIIYVILNGLILYNNTLINIKSLLLDILINILFIFKINTINYYI